MKSLTLLLIVPIIVLSQDPALDQSNTFNDRILVSFYAIPNDNPVSGKFISQTTDSSNSVFVESQSNKPQNMRENSSCKHTLPLIEVKCPKPGNTSSSEEGFISFFLKPQVNPEGNSFNYQISWENPLNTQMAFDLGLVSVEDAPRTLGTQQTMISFSGSENIGCFEMPSGNVPLEVTISVCYPAHGGSKQVFQSVYLSN